MSIANGRGGPCAVEDAQAPAGKGAPRKRRVPMQFASALSREVKSGAAVSAVLERVAPRFPEHHAPLSFVFASSHHLKAFPRLLHVMQERFATHTLIGCTGGGVIG